jgi:hypothetical protein
MALGDDAWDYYNAMVGFQPPQTPRVPTAIRECSANLSGSDSAYHDVCPDPWVEIGAVPDSNTVETVFARAYFTWAQKYVREAVLHKPNSFASAKAKILWTLDIATVMTVGLVATNVPLGSGHPLFGIWGSIAAEFRGTLELMRSSVLSRLSAYPAQQRAAQVADIAPAPFGTLPVMWCKGYIRNPRGPDLIYKRIYGALTMQGGWDQFKNFLPKFYNEYQAALGGGDLPLAKGMQQWWLWCVRDGVQASGPILDPLNLGPWNNTPELSWYINTVQTTESASPELVRKEGAAAGGRTVLYPNFATSFSSYDRIAGPFLALRFDKVVQDQLTLWLQRSLPLVDANNRPLLNAQGYPLQSPVTFVDAAAIFKGDRAAVEAQANAAIHNPSAGLCNQAGVNWGGSNVAIPQVPAKVAYVADVAGQSNALSVAQSVPQSIHVPSCNEIAQMGGDELRSALGPFAGALDWLGSKLLRVVGAAMGVGWRLPIINQPFVRTFTTPGFRTVPDGSTLDVVPRVMTAVQNISGLLGLSLCAQCPQVVAQSTLVPAYAPTNTPGTPEYLEALRQRIVAAATPAFQKLVQTPEYKAMLAAQAAKSPRGRFTRAFLHAGEPQQLLPTVTSEERLFAQRAAERAAPTSFTARFFKSLARTGNPIRS